MKTPYLDKEIELLEGFKENKEASFYQLRKLAEYREIKQLLLHDVSKRLFRFSGLDNGKKFIEEIESIDSNTAIYTFNKELPHLKWTTITDIT